MNFKTWWINNHQGIVNASNFFLLPRKWKTIIRLLIVAIDGFIANDATAFTNLPAPTESQNLA